MPTLKVFGSGSTAQRRGRFFGMDHQEGQAQSGSIQIGIPANLTTPVMRIMLQ